MNSSAIDFINADLLVTVLETFNPFAADDRPTELQCGVGLLSVENGLVTLGPMAVQSDRMTMLGAGTIDLTTEALNLEWVSKPRKGIGLSASVVTNDYIKIGGTLSQPALELQSLKALASTGTAVATLGASLVGKGLWNRITAERKVCKRARKEVKRRSKY